MNYQIAQNQKPQKALILQGDWEGGISHLALDMINSGVDVTKVIFNAADWIYNFHNVPTVSYSRPYREFEQWLRHYISEHNIDCIIIYNQYRPYNAVGWSMAEELDIQCIVLELGLLRPDYCTVYSRKYDHFSYLKQEWTRLKERNISLNEPLVPPQLGKMNTMKKMSRFALFFLFSRVIAIFFRRYTHYIDQRGQVFFPHFNALIMNGLRYQGRGKQAHFNSLFATTWDNQYYLVPLQVHCDSQITKRSNYTSIEAFIDDVVESFLEHAPKDTKLVFKVHPMDRGYKDYHQKIKKINESNGNRRIFYVDRIHLPTAITHCQGCVTINSTVGLSALHHYKKLICLGQAAFNLESLTYRGSLDQFWTSDFKPEENQIRNFINLLKYTSQANGTLFQKLYSTKGHSKINWPWVFKTTLDPK